MKGTRNTARARVAAILAVGLGCLIVWASVHNAAKKGAADAVVRELTTKE